MRLFFRLLQLQHVAAMRSNGKTSPSSREDRAGAVKIHPGLFTPCSCGSLPG
jgi:hypothetical protein